MRLLIFSLCSLFGLVGLPCQNGSPDMHPKNPADLKILWYNAENFFHPSDDSLPGDDDFTPEGIRGWTMKRYRSKLAAIARVILASGGWDPPSLVALCEVEHARVLEDLVQHPILRPWSYHYLHREGPDHRGMEVALLFRDPDFRVISWDCIPPPEMPGMDGSREILHVRGCLERGDSLDLMLCHFISRYRGSGASAPYRRRQADLLRQKADSLCRGGFSGLVILAGDFNDSWDSFSLAPLRERRDGGTPIEPLLPSPSGHSYKYRGKWSHLDMFLLAGERGGNYFRTTVISLPGMLVKDEAWGGQKPFRTYEGVKYRGGYSDHLPLLLEISGEGL